MGAAGKDDKHVRSEGLWMQASCRVSGRQVPCSYTCMQPNVTDKTLLLLKGPVQCSEQKSAGQLSTQERRGHCAHQPLLTTHFPN